MNSTLALISGLGLGLGFETSGLGLGLEALRLLALALKLPALLTSLTETWLNDDTRTFSKYQAIQSCTCCSGWTVGMAVVVEE